MALRRLPHQGLKGSAEHRRAVDVAEVDRQTAAPGVDIHLAEELQAAVRRQVPPARWRRLLEHDLRTEGAVQRIRAERTRVERTVDEFPECIEIVECSL